MLSFIRLRSLIPVVLFFLVISATCDAPKKQKKSDDSTPRPKVEDTKKSSISTDMFLVNVSVSDVRAAADSQSEMVTQALLADPVSIIDASDKVWSKVKVPDGYTGYVKTSELTKVTAHSIYLANGRVAMVKADNVPLLEAPQSETELGRAFRGSQLALISTETNWLEVAMPNDRRGWIRTEDAVILPYRDGSPKGTPNNVIAMARFYLGAPYLWGGVTPQGIDCSALTYYAYLFNGVKLPRDADKQFEVGTKIEKKSDLKKGDLVFFATDVPKPDITHVGIYIGNRQFLHAANRVKGTIIGSLEEAKYESTFMGGRRYLDTDEHGYER